MIHRVPLPLLMVVSAILYHAALWLEPVAVWLVAGSMAALGAMVFAKTARRAFYGGIAASMMILVPQLWFFSGIFQIMAVALWLLLALWTGLFCGTLHVIHRKWGIGFTLLAAPVLWMGLEYFRSEVWLLRFSWMTPGYALPAAKMGWLFQSLGVFGSGALLVLAGVSLVLLKKPALALSAGLLIPALLLPGQRSVVPAGSLRITGLQFEEGGADVMLSRLEEALTAYPDTGLFVLPEYSFGGPVPKAFMEWCQKNQRWLVAGGQDYAPGLLNARGIRTYYNTAWVVGPEGNVVHRQAKSVPIQFFTDGMPAPGQKVWESPWGKLGLCICYDQNYTKVTDPLARQNMRALIIPTMDIIRWGPWQHWLSARLAASRAVEYGVPVIRIASSGISLILNAQGQVLASGSIPGQGEIVSAVVSLSAGPRQPWDRWFAKLAPIPAGLLIVWALTVSFIDERRRKRGSKAFPLKTPTENLPQV